MIRGLFCSIAFLVIATSALAQSIGAIDTSHVTLRVGVRVDARPFSHKVENFQTNNYSTKSGPLRAEGYEGYMVYICDEVFKQMSVLSGGGPQFDLAQVDPVDVVLDETADRFDLLENDIDILCDPSTITLDRVRRFSVSPPLFATGISFLTLENKRLPDPDALGSLSDEEAFIGFVGKTTAQDYGIGRIVDSGEWNRYKPKIIAALRGTEENGVDPRRGVIKSFPSHSALAAAFCRGNVFHYVGDLEIISFYASSQPGCDWQRAPNSYSSDRYGIFANVNYAGDAAKALLIGRFFEVLNREIATRDSLLDRAFRATFREQRKTHALDVFYWSIRGKP